MRQVRLSGNVAEVTYVRQAALVAAGAWRLDMEARPHLGTAMRVLSSDQEVGMVRRSMRLGATTSTEPC
jgi:hypothetical protein